MPADEPTTEPTALDVQAGQLAYVLQSLDAREDGYMADDVQHPTWEEETPDAQLGYMRRASAVIATVHRMGWMHPEATPILLDLERKHEEQHRPAFIPPPSAFGMQVSVGGETYPFYESEEGTLFGWGHQDKAGFIAAVARWRAEVDGSNYDLSERIEAADVKHVIAVGYLVGDSVDEWRFNYEPGHTLEDPGSFPLTVWDAT